MLPTTPPSGNWVRRHRLRLGLTQAELGAALGYTGLWVCLVEKGKLRAKLAVRWAICWLLREHMGESEDGEP